MNFVSLEFFLLLGSILCVLPLCSHRQQNFVLLIASYTFYGWWNWKYVFLIAGISLLDYCCAVAIDATKGERRRKLVLTAGIVANLGILAYFKYTDFFIESVNSVVGTNWPLMHVLLPIGVSFHTFQSMGYTIDVYRREIPPIRNPIDYQLFVTFFPQLVAGPIERATRLLPQVLKDRRVDKSDISAGLKLMLLGFFKKVVIADNLAPLVDVVFSTNRDELTGGAVVLGTYAFALQIYCDFSGYTDIARGVARLLGFSLMENFKQPYFATNPSDFWRRWHISLSTWLRDYLYIPLGGNRRGVVRTYIALALTMLIGGIWHGAAWTFVLWGAYHGVLLIIHRMIGFKSSFTDWTSGRILSAVAFFQLTCVGWLIFRARNWEELRGLASAIVTPTDWMNVSAVNVRLLCASILVILIIDLWNEAKLRFAAPPYARGASFALAVVAIVLWSPESVSSFIYFQF